MENFEEIDDFEEVEKFNKAFDKYFAKIQKAEAKYKENNNIKQLISFWEKLWATEKVHNLSYKWAFRLTNLYIQIEEYDKALVALHYIDETPYFINNNGLYNSYLKRINKSIEKKNKEKIRSTPKVQQKRTKNT